MVRLGQNFEGQLAHARSAPRKKQHKAKGSKSQALPATRDPNKHSQHTDLDVNIGAHAIDVVARGGDEGQSRARCRQADAAKQQRHGGGAAASDGQEADCYDDVL